MLTLKDTTSLLKEVEKILTEEGTVKELVVGSYAKMQYPKHFPYLKFQVKQFLVEDFGNVMLMQAKAMGMMHLATIAFTPNLGSNVPFLLIDCMSFGKKRAVFVEYYDVTAEKQSFDSLVKIAKQYEHLPEYEEKPAWYVPLRTSYSLVKGNMKKEEPELIGMLLSEVRAYVKLSQEKKERKIENRIALREFRERMITEGTPSSTTLNKVLGEDGAKIFYRTCFMPMMEDEKE